MTQTVGDAIEARGPCELMVKVMELAEALRRIPAGEWHYTFTTAPIVELAVNGGKKTLWRPCADWPNLRRFEAAVMVSGWPAATFNAAGGVVINVREADLIAWFDREIAAVKEAR